jgi:uncharacterized protein
MRMLVWAFRILIIMFIMRLVLRAIFPRRTGRAARKPSARVAERAGGALVRDPQCGTYIPQAGAVSAGGTAGAVFFCSDRCRDAWLTANGRAVRSA